MCTNVMKTQTLNSPIRLFGCSNNTQEVNSLFNFNSEIIMHFRKEKKMPGFACMFMGFHGHLGQNIGIISFIGQIH